MNPSFKKEVVRVLSEMDADDGLNQYVSKEPIGYLVLTLASYDSLEGWPLLFKSGQLLGFG